MSLVLNSCIGQWYGLWVLHGHVGNQLTLHRENVILALPLPSPPPPARLTLDVISAISSPPPDPGLDLMCGQVHALFYKAVTSWVGRAGAWLLYLGCTWPASPSCLKQWPGCGGGGGTAPTPGWRDGWGADGGTPPWLTAPGMLCCMRAVTN